MMILATIPTPSLAIELSWSTGATNINVTAAAQCTLLVHTSANEASLPDRWRLVYIVDGPAPRFIAETPSDDVAAACQIVEPSGLHEVVGNVRSVTHCSNSKSRASVA